MKKPIVVEIDGERVTTEVRTSQVPQRLKKQKQEKQPEQPKHDFMTGYETFEGAVGHLFELASLAASTIILREDHGKTKKKKRRALR